MIQISSFDTSSRLIGWTSGTGETVPDCGVWSLEQAGDDLGHMLNQLFGYLSHHWTVYRPGAVIIEAPIHKPTDSLLTMRKLYPAAAFVEWFFVNKGVEVSDESAQNIKRRVTGNRFAEKDELVEVARKCGLILPKGPGAKDAADSWGGWLLGVDHYNRQFQPRWDQLIHGPRGRLL